MPLVFAFGVGLVFGSFDKALYASSLTTAAALVVVASLGPRPGLSGWTGFVLGDLFLRDPAKAHIWVGQGTTAGFTDLYGPLLVSYVLLAGLLVFAPVLAARVRMAAVRFMRKGSRSSARADGFGAFVGIAVQALYVVSWSQGAQALIRPLFSYGSAAVTADTYAFRTQGRVAVLVAVAVGANAAVLLNPRLERLRLGHGDASAAGGSVPIFVSVLFQAVALTLTLSGLVSSAGTAAALGAVLLVLLSMRALVFPTFSGVVGLFRRVPVLVRLMLLAALSYVVSIRLVAPAWHGRWFSPAVVAFASSLLLSSILLSPERRVSGRSTQPYGLARATGFAIVAAFVLAFGPPSVMADNAPWWKQQTERTGTTTASFSWSGTTHGGISGVRISCSYRTGSPYGGYAEYQVAGGNVAPGGALFAYVPSPDPKAGAGDVLIHIHEATGPGAYPIGKLSDFSIAALGDITGATLGFNDEWLAGDRPTALVGLAAFESGGDEFDFASGTDGQKAGARGNVTVRSDGSGSVAGTLEGYFTGDVEHIQGSWGPCTIRSASGAWRGGSSVVPTLSQNELEAAAKHDSDPGLLVPLLAVLILAPELAGLRFAAEGAEVAVTDAGAGAAGVEGETAGASLRGLFGDDAYGEYQAQVATLRARYPEFAELSDDELISVRGYSGTDYEEINTALREGDAAEIARLEPQISNIRSGLEKLPNYEGNVFRGTRLTQQEIEAYRSAAESGKPLVERGFTSATTNWAKRFSGNTEYVIESVHGKNITNIAFNGERESEVLFTPDSRFTVELVREWEPGKFEIFMRELPGVSP